MKYDEHTYDNLDEDLKINKNDLAREWVKQPQLFNYYAEAAAYFKKKAMEAQERVKLVEAELKMEAGDNPEACFGNGVKATNDRIAVYARSHRQYQEAFKEYTKAQYRSDMAENAVFAFHQRKSALENLVRLASMDYFSTPRDSGDTREYLEEQTHKVAVRKTAETLNKGRRRS